MRLIKKARLVSILLITVLFIMLLPVSSSAILADIEPDPDPIPDPIPRPYFADPISPKPYCNPA